MRLPIGAAIGPRSWTSLEVRAMSVEGAGVPDRVALGWVGLCVRPLRVFCRALEVVVAAKLADELVDPQGLIFKGDLS